MTHEQVIHSGHFMTSNPHLDDMTADDDEDIEVDVVEDDEKPEEMCHPKDKELDGKPVTFYKFGPKKTQSIAIDVSLNKLNKCIKVAYNKMTTPKWKDFKGLRLDWKQRIRLNNVIWRAYYIEFKKKAFQKTKKKTPFCYFAVPDDDMTHQKLEGSLVEGMYWKRRMEAVCAQYKRWRVRSRNSIHLSHPGILMGVPHHSMSIKRKRNPSEGHPVNPRNDGEPMTKQQRSQTPKHFGSEYFDYDDFENVFTDELFESLSQPYAFPNPKDTWQSGNADIMQPGLLPLQPSLEEIMSSLGDFPDPETSTSNKMEDMQHTQQQQQQHSMPPPPSHHSHHHHQQQQQRQNSQMVNPVQSLSRPRQPIHVPTKMHQHVHHQNQQQHLQQQQQQHQQQNRAAQQQDPPDYLAASMLVDYSSRAVAMNRPLAQHPPAPSVPSTSSLAHPQAQYTIYSMRNGPSNVTAPAAISMFQNLNSESRSDYMPQFLQSPSSSVVPSPNSMMAPSRTWWLDSPLTASVQSPLSVSTPMTSNNHGPNTPMNNIFNGAPATPPSSILRVSEVLHQGLIDDISHHTPLQQHHPPTKTTLAHRLEQPAIIDEKNIAVLDVKSAFMSPPKDWPNGRNGQRMGLTASDWKNDTSAHFQQTAAFINGTVALAIPSTSGTANPTPSGPPLSRQTSEPVGMKREPSNPPHLVNIAASTSAEMKEPKEELILSAPSSVKPARGSRQVQADSTLHPEERKRILHLHAEQNRRMALKDGFDKLMELIPDLHSGGIKPTNAVVLARSAEQIKRLQSKKEKLEEMKAVAQAKVDKLNQKIAALQSNLPCSSGVSSSTSSAVDRRISTESFYDRFMKEKAKRNWKFWVMSRMLEPICVSQNNSFAATVAGEGSSREEISATCSEWINNHWKATELRPLASTLLVHLATNTNVLMEPESLPKHVEQELKGSFNQ